MNNHQMTRRARRSAKLIALSTTMLSAVPAIAQDVATPSSAGLEEIVVTAQKREQNLQNVPISITALTANTLVANRIQDVRDLSAVVPNLTVRPVAGGTQIPNYTLRGIYANGSAPGVDKGVALYIDGVYVQNAAGSIFETADIERIEVLKGPQGTLFGRNATGGAISFVTRDPRGELFVRQDLTYGNYDQFRSRTRIDLPQFGPLKLAATYLHKERRGDVRNLGAGTRWDYGPATGGAYGVRTSPRYLGGENGEAVTVAAALDVHPDVKIVYKYDYSEDRYTPGAAGVSYFPAGFLTPLYLAQDPSLRTPVSKTRPKAVNNAFTTPGFSRNLGHNLTGSWQATDYLSFKNILAYRSNKLTSTFQLDGIGGLLNNPVAALGGIPPAWLGNDPRLSGCARAPATPICQQSIGKPLAYLVNNGFNNLKQFSEEFQVNLQTDLVTATAGFLHFHNTQDTQGLPGTINAPIFPAFFGQGTSAQGTPFTIASNPGYVPSHVNVTSDALYIQPELHLTPRLDIVGGYRKTWDRKRGLEYFPIQPRTPATSPIRYRDSENTYLAGVNYRPIDGILTYAKYSTGYISGGQLATVTFGAEKAKSWEAGVKADLFDRKLRTNLAVFDVKYKSIQFATSGTLSGVPAALPFGTAVIPSADAHAYGAEWENTLVPLDGLTLTANVGYLHFKFDQDTVFGGTFWATGQNCFGSGCLAYQAGTPNNLVASGGFLAAAGGPGYLEFARPKWTGNLAAQYETDEVFAGGKLSFRVDGNFQSKSLLTSDVTPGTTAGNAATGTVSVAPESAVLRAAATKPFGWIVNSRVALTGFSLAGTKATVALWGRNIFDNKDINQFVGLGPVGTAIYERARTYGIDLSVEFR